MRLNITISTAMTMRNRQHTSKQRGSYEQCPTDDPTDDSARVNGSDGPTTPRAVSDPGPVGVDQDQKNVPVGGENGPYGPEDDREYSRPGQVAAEELSWKDTAKGYLSAFKWVCRAVVLIPVLTGITGSHDWDSRLPGYESDEQK